MKILLIFNVNFFKNIAKTINKLCYHCSAILQIISANSDIPIRSNCKRTTGRRYEGGFSSLQFQIF